MEKREEILKKALELFCSRGYDAVGVQEIAVCAGVTKPTLYYYFKSKYLMKTLCNCVQVFVDFAEQTPKLYRLLFSMFHSPQQSETYRCVHPYILRQQGTIRSIFDAASGQLGNMHGRQRQFGLGFSGLVHYFIVMKFEESKDEGIHVSNQEIYSLVHQFMHGIYS